jgi:gluconolactonase
MAVKDEKRDSAIRKIVPRGAELERVAGGLGFTEGPVWCGDYLLFSDIYYSRIVRLRLLSNGPELTTFRSPSGGSNGMTLDGSRRLVVCEHYSRRVTRTEVDGTVKVLAEHYKGKRLNSPNDVVVRSDGSIFFTDPHFGLGVPPQWKEQSFNGVYRLAPDGELELLVDDFDMPNGLAFSPDESVLYVDDSARRHIRAFDIDKDGSVTRSRMFIEMGGKEVGLPDGMKVDTEGNVYCTGPGGIWVIAPDGTCLGRIMMDEQPANVAWGDADWKSLYITACTSVYRLRLNVPGIAVYEDRI